LPVLAATLFRSISSTLLSVNLSPGSDCAKIAMANVSGSRYRANGRRGFGEGTFARTYRNDEDAPQADSHTLAFGLPHPTHSGPSTASTATAGPCPTLSSDAAAKTLLNA
jgi:hypothetical protein